MVVYVAWWDGNYAVCETMKIAQLWVMDRITEDGEDDGEGTDPFEGWEWWQSDGKLIFGAGKELQDKRGISEGYLGEAEIETVEVISE